MANDHAIRHHDLVREYDHPELGTLRMLGQPVVFSDTPTSDPGRPPTLGEHTDTILHELGYDAATIGELRAAGVIGGARNAAARSLHHDRPRGESPRAGTGKA
jgi:crotonobetainyl-CoA:carnitine CoA-transferase CaiB-like acyl-CoA transferase